MTTPSKPYVKIQPPSKDQLRDMLAQAVRNTDPELNSVAAPAPAPKAKGRARPAKVAPARPTAKQRKGRA